MGLVDRIKASRLAQAAEVTEKKAGSAAETPGVHLDPNGLTATLAPGESLDDIEALLRKRNIDPANWIVDRVTVNEWESSAKLDGQWVSTTLHQLKVFLKASIQQLVLPARIDGPVFMHSAPVIALTERKVLVIPDSHFPYVEQALWHALLKTALRWKPDEVIILGDFVDFDAFDNHRKDFKRRPGYPLDKLFQEAIDSGYEALRDLRQAVSQASIVFIPGNHEQHLERELLTHFPQAKGVVRPGDDRPLMSVPYLLRMDELHIEYLGAPDAIGPDYPFAYHDIIPGVGGLFAIHGEIVRPIGGMSAYQHLERYGFQRSIIMGHTHRMGIVRRRNRVGIEAGYMGQKNLGYPTDLDSAQGFVLLRIKDRKFAPTLALWLEGELAIEDDWISG